MQNTTGGWFCSLYFKCKSYRAWRRKLCLRQTIRKKSFVNRILGIDNLENVFKQFHYFNSQLLHPADFQKTLLLVALGIFVIPVTSVSWLKKNCCLLRQAICELWKTCDWLFVKCSKDSEILDIYYNRFVNEKV